MKTVKALIIVGILVFLISCKGNFISVEEVCKKYDTRVPSEEEFPDDDAVIIFDNTKWEMKINESYKLKTSQERRVIKKIFNNLNKHSIIKIPVYDGDEVFEISARTIKPDGSIIPVEKEDIYTIEGFEGGSEFYSDMEYRKFTFPGLEEGCIIEYYFKKYVDFPFLRDIWLLQDEIPILYSEYSLIIPELLMTRGEFKWYYKVYNDKTLKKAKMSEVIQATSIEVDKQVKFNWIKKDVKPFKHEPLMPKGLAEIPHVRFRPGYWKNWNDLSNWYFTKIFKRKMIESDAINEKARDLTKGIDGDSQKIKACYDFVKDIRYISINLNNGGISPKEPEKVLKNNFGDCKDKSILLISLLKSLNIKAEPVLLLTNNKGIFDKDFTAWNFNHMIVAIKKENDKYLWLDPTAEYTEFGSLPAMDQDVDALILHEDGKSTIRRTQSSNFNENKKVINLDIEIQENLKSNLVFNINYFGEDRSKIKHRIDTSNEKEIKEFCKSMITNEILDSSIETVTYSDSMSHEFFNLSFTVKDVNVIQKQGELFFVSYNFLPFISDMNWLNLDERRFPLHFSYPQSVQKIITIKYPTNLLKLKNSPKNFSDNTNNLISYSQKINANSSELEIVKDLSIIDKIVKKNEYSKFREIFKIIQQKNKEHLIFE